MLKTKHIFICGAGISGLGKGIVSASIGRILTSYDYNVTIQKMDPYFNSSASSLNPVHHGEVYVLPGGREGDIDLGTYWRFIEKGLVSENSITSGIIYANVLKNEREGKYLGDTIQIIPHITNEIKRYIHFFDDQYDIVIHEIGGNIKDIEAAPYIETIRQIQYELNSEDCLIILLVYLPFLKTTQEVKTKIAQQGVEQCRSLGINPDILIARSEQDFNDSVKNKMSLFTNIKPQYIIKNLDAESIYQIPKMLADEGIINALKDKLRINISLVKESGNYPFNQYNHAFNEWNELVLNNHTNEVINIGLVGKYTTLHDAYISVIESLRFAGWKNKVKVNIDWIDSEKVEDGSINLTNRKLKGILIPGGFGNRGIEGMIIAAQFARENNIPYLGICLGAQIAWIEFARNVLSLKDANSEEFNNKSSNLVIHYMDNQRNLQEMAGTLRLGAFDCNLARNSISYEYYKEDQIQLIHRHRYEFNNQYRKLFEDNGVRFAGLSPDGQLVEITELVNHPFFVASQAHNEYGSYPGNPDPLFNAFIYMSKNINRTINM